MPSDFGLAGKRSVAAGHESEFDSTSAYPL